MLYESLLLIGVLAAAVILPSLLLGLAFKLLLPQSVIRVYVFLVLGLYFIWHWRQGKQTLAMQSWKLRIAGRDGQPPTLTRLAWRYVLAWPSIGLFGVGILWALIDRDRQFLHDRLAGTRIVFA